MKKLTKEEANEKVKQIDDMYESVHEDFEVQKILADLWWTLAETPFYFLSPLYWKVKKANNRHIICCELDKV